MAKSSYRHTLKINVQDLRSRRATRWYRGEDDNGDGVRGGGVGYVEAPAVALSYGTGAALEHSGGGLRERI
jgi:hypothetical protein